LAENFEVHFWAQFSTLGGFFRGLDINFEVRFPKRFDPCVKPHCPIHHAWKSAGRS